MTPLEQAAKEFENAGLAALLCRREEERAEKAMREARVASLKAQERCDEARWKLLALAAPALPNAPQPGSGIPAGARPIPVVVTPPASLGDLGPPA